MRRILPVGFSILLLLTFCVPQDGPRTGSIRGEVVTRNQNGEPAVLPDARIVLRGPTNREARSDASGAFAIDGLPPAMYDVEASAPGLNSTLAVDELRPSQIEETLSDAARQDPRRPLIIAGDFNLDASKDRASSALAATGFQDAIAAPRPTTPSRRLLEPGRQIDWAFVRGPVRAGSGRVHNQVKASAHYPISFTLTASHT